MRPHKRGAAKSARDLLLPGILREDKQVLSGISEVGYSEIEAFRTSLAKPGVEKLSTSVDLPFPTRPGAHCTNEESEAMRGTADSPLPASKSVCE